MMKLSDYTTEFLVNHGVNTFFLASGGGIMYLLDSIGRNPGAQYYCNYHEQACAVAAEGYVRMTGRLAACMGTTGPGATNLLSGIMAAWIDSVPLLAISGQVRSDLIADYSKVRQVGPQEGNVVAMAGPVTKYAVSVRDPNTIRYHLERALYEATTGRPGPVWLELPLDVQGASVEETKLIGFSPESVDAIPSGRIHTAAADVIQLLKRSQRPVVVPGNGIHYSYSRDLLRSFVEQANIPVLLPFTAKDLLEEDHPLNMGVFGSAGQRRANFAIQNSDLLLALAVGLNVQKTGFNVSAFAPKAHKVVVDIDTGQLIAHPLKPDVAIQADVREFLGATLEILRSEPLPQKTRWLQACGQWRQRYPVMRENHPQEGHSVNTYIFMDTLAELLGENDVLVTGVGLDVVSCYQAFRVKKNQRVIITGWGSMGWELPLTLGACVGNGARRAVCVTGDGSLQWNVQEMLTVGRYKFPIKLFVFNNSGYSSIRSTQNSFFDGRFVGSDFHSGLANPEFSCLAAAYGWNFVRISGPESLADSVQQALELDGPVLCEVPVPVNQGIAPKASAFRRDDGTLESRPLEDMAPFLPREEVWDNMHLFDNDRKDS